MGKRARALVSLTVLLGATAGFWASPALGYEEEIAVGDGGAIVGRVTLKGSVPKPRIFPLVLYPFGPFCKKISDGQGNVRLQEFTVGPDRGLMDAIVAVQEVTRGKPFPPVDAEFVAVNCMFHPADVPDEEQFAARADGRLRHDHPVVRVFQNHKRFSVTNRDPIIHNAQLFQSEKGNIVLNLPMGPLTDPPKRFEGILSLEPGKRIVQLICGMHEFMQSWGVMVDNPYYAKTKKDGRFTIENLPPGTYQVTAWHPHLTPIVRQVTVPANGAVELHVEFDAGTIQRPIYESQREFRIGPATPHDHTLNEKDERIIME